MGGAVRGGSEGRHANAWSAAATGIGGTSSSLEVTGYPFVSAFGSVDGAATITLQVSQNGTTWYDSSLTFVAGGAGDFYIGGTIGARFVRLKSSADVAATATIAAHS